MREIVGLAVGCLLYTSVRTLPAGWRILVRSSHTEFERAFGRSAEKKRKLYNGMLKCDAFFYHGGTKQE